MTTAAATLVVMPKLSDTMEGGTIVAWLVGDGLPVSLGQELVEIETDKAITVYQAPAHGVLRRIAADGETVAVGEPIAKLVGPGTRDGSAQAEPERSSATATERPVPPGSDGARVVASPLARRKAQAARVDIRLVPGSARGGRIVSGDVNTYLEQSTSNKDGGGPAALAQSVEPEPAAPKQTAKRLPFNGSQVLVAKRMTEAHTIPDFQTAVEIDMEECLRLRTSLKELDRMAAVPSLNDLLIRACALALKEHRLLNSFYLGDACETHDAVHIGMAMTVDDRLLVPTIRNAESRDVLEIAAESKRLVTRVRNGSVTPAELSGATFTVSNLGMLGVDDFTAMISPPQVGILAVGRVAQRPVVLDDQITIHSTMRATLSADHRVVYGADAGRFLASLRELLERPIAMLFDRS